MQAARLRRSLSKTQPADAGTCFLFWTASARTWRADDSKEADELKNDLEQWRESCIEQLPDVQMKHKKRAGYMAKQFQEPSEEVEDWLITQARADSSEVQRRWSSAL